MDQPFDALFELNKNTEIRYIGDCAFNLGPGGIIVGGRLPGIGLELLDAKGEPFMFFVDLENNRLDSLALGIFFRWMLDPFRPGEVRDVNQAVNALFNTDKYTKIGDIFNLALDNGANGIGLFHHIPGIGQQLFHAQGNPLGFGFHLEHLHFDFITDRDKFGRMLGFLRPAHFRDMHQSFHALFQLDENTVVGDGDDLALDLGTGRVFFGNQFPWIGLQLFDTKGNAVRILVIFENFDLDFLADGIQLGGMGNPAPGEIGNMTEAVHAAQVDEQTVIGDIGNGAADGLALFQGGAHALAQFGALLLQDGPAGDNDIVPFAVEFEDFELKGLADQGVKVLDRAQVDL